MIVPHHEASLSHRYLFLTEAGARIFWFFCHWRDCHHLPSPCRHSSDLERTVAHIWRNCRVSPIPNTYICGGSGLCLAPAELVGPRIDPGTELGSRQKTNWGVHGFMPHTSFPMAARSTRAAFCEGTCWGLPVASVPFLLPIAFHFSGLRSSVGP